MSTILKLALAVGLLFAVAQAAEPTPVNVRTAPGRFEIAAVDPSAAHVVATAAEEAWRMLAGPLGLPEGFSTPIFVHVATAGPRDPPVPFRVTVEPGAVVSLQLTLGRSVDEVTRRALVQALLMRLAVSVHGITARLEAPLWLEQACVGWWQTRADAARLDALKFESRELVPPPLTALLAWQRGGPEPRELSAAAVWLLTFLQTESGRNREWPALLERVLGGAEPLTAVASSFPDRFADADERESWWATGFHQARRVRVLPALESADSRAQLGALARFVFAGEGDEVDRVLALGDVLAHAAEPIVAAELARRATETERLIPALHAFYRNAGLALAEALRTGPKKPTRRAALSAAFEQDWRDAVELEGATAAALDALEAKLRQR